MINKAITEEIFKRRTAELPSLGTVVYADSPEMVMQAKVDDILDSMQWWKRESDRSKWERIGQPLFESIVDWGIIINPYTPPKYRLKAIQRQIERFVELS